jgi:hypothetical protein
MVGGAFALPTRVAWNLCITMSAGAWEREKKWWATAHPTWLNPFQDRQQNVNLVVRLLL